MSLVREDVTILETNLDIYSEEEYSLDKEIECLMKSLFPFLKRKKNIQETIQEVLLKPRDKCQVLKRFEKKRGKLIL
jgi:hypothetical protein